VADARGGRRRRGRAARATGAALHGRDAQARGGERAFATAPHRTAPQEPAWTGLCGLQGLWSVGILHCDLKPDNFLLWVHDDTGPAGEAKGPGLGVGLVLIDLGQAVDLHAQPPTALLKGSVGASGYDCPAMRGAGRGARTRDAHALAATAFALLTGRPLPATGWED
jgi:serine/threonine protein kinase